MTHLSEEHSTPAQKAIVCGTAFCTSCTFFMLGVLLLLPLVDPLLGTIGVPELLAQAVVMFVIFGAPVLGAILGLHLGLRATGSYRDSPCHAAKGT